MQNTQHLGTHAKNGAKMMGLFFLVSPGTYVVGSKLFMKTDEQWKADERNQHKTGNTYVNEMREARRDSLKTFKEKQWQQEDNHEYGKTWKRFDDTAIRRTNTYRPGGILSQEGADAWKAQRNSA